MSYFQESYRTALWTAYGNLACDTSTLLSRFQSFEALGNPF